jgi:hypothetical protein
MADGTTNPLFSMTGVEKVTACGFDVRMSKRKM